MISLRKLLFPLSLVPVFAGTTLVVMAQDSGAADKIAGLESAVAAAQGSADNAWMLTSTALVLMMTGPGLALFYSGLVRRKNVLATMAQSFVLMALVTVLWALYGYSVAFGEGNAFFGDLRYVFMHDVGSAPNPDYAATIPQQTFMLFQLMFAVITPALITGAFAERIKFKAMIAFTTLWATIIYFPLAHMVWGKGGFLNAALGGTIPALDFAGGTVVHIASGFSALICALYIGKRIGYSKEPISPHNLVLSVIGACMLWVGWFGFNAGSALGSNGLATSAFTATHFAAATATLGWMCAEWLRNGKPTVLGMISGAVCGLVGITPAAGFVTPMAALLIGFVAGLGCFFMVTVVKERFGYDDSLDVFGVHGAGGTIGALLTGIFATRAINPIFKSADGQPLPVGLLDGNYAQVLNQLLAVAITIGISVIGSFVLLKLVDLVIGLRVSEAGEIEGLDKTEHGEASHLHDFPLPDGLGDFAPASASGD
jgi:Amt family ammonium transporter